MTRGIPRLVIALAGVHFLVAVLAWSTFGEVARDGFWNTAPDNPPRESEMWFFLSGFGLLALGTMSQRIAASTGKLPAQLGGYLLAIGIPLQIMYPASGAPGLIVLGVLAVIASRNGAKARTSAEVGPHEMTAARH